MKIYDFQLAPNPRRVRIFLAEKGIKVPCEQVNLMTADNRKPEFLAKNPFGGLPVLEMDDGTHLAESVAICRYFEETHPEPRLMGADAKQRAIVDMWNRRMELGLFQLVGQVFQNTSPMFKDRIRQVPEYGEVARASVLSRLEQLDGFLAKTKFVAGEHYTIADITALVAVDFAKMAGIDAPPQLKNLARWHKEVSGRPSASA